MSAPSSLLDWLHSIMSDPEASAAFRHDPEGYASAHGLADLTAADLHDAVALLADSAPADYREWVASRTFPEASAFGEPDPDFGSGFVPGETGLGHSDLDEGGFGHGSLDEAGFGHGEAGFGHEGQDEPDFGQGGGVQAGFGHEGLDEPGFGHGGVDQPSYEHGGGFAETDFGRGQPDLGHDDADQGDFGHGWSA